MSTRMCSIAHACHRHQSWSVISRRMRHGFMRLSTIWRWNARKSWMISCHLALSYLPRRRHSRMPRHHPVFWLSPWRTVISFRRRRHTFRMLDLLSALAQNQVALPMPTRVPTSFRVHRHIYRMLVLLSVLAQDQVALPIPPLPIPPLEVALPIPPLPTPPLRRGMVHSAVPAFSRREWAMREYRILAPGGPVGGRRGYWHEQIRKI